MFSTILDRITSYFDRRALFSAFFPSLIFWAIAGISIMVPLIGLNNAIKSWNSLSGIVQALFLLAFFVWITFWSFLTQNFRTSLLNIFEGYWPDKWLFAKLLESRRQHWKKCWDERDPRDRPLEQDEILLKLEVEGYENLPGQFQDEGQVVKLIRIGDEDQVGQELDAFLEHCQVDIQQFEVHSPPITTIQQLGQKVRAQWSNIAPWLKEAERDLDNIWAKRVAQLTKITTKMEELTRQLLGEVQDQREWLHRDFCMYFPQTRPDVMPTRLGNVLKAAEMYAWNRYRIDSVVIWTRLQQALPEKFAESLQDAKGSLDAMITLSTFILLFGSPLSLWMVFELFKTGIFFWGISLLLTSAVLFIILFLSWLCYQNAIQAGIEYGEKIKAAIDLYRWKVLEELNLRLPAGLEEERQLWEDVCGLLGRGYDPETPYFQYKQQEPIQNVEDNSQSRVKIPVPTKDIPAFHTIAAEYLIEQDILETLVPIDAVQKKEDIVDLIPLRALPAQQPIRRPLLVESKRFEHTIALGVQATLASALGGNLQPGDLVDIILLPQGTQARHQLEFTLFDDILIIDIQPAYKNDPMQDRAIEEISVLILAIPLDKRMEFIHAYMSGTMLLSRRTFRTSTETDSI
jgi:Flp pilus assembly protein CpaB